MRPSDFANLTGRLMPARRLCNAMSITASEVSATAIPVSRKRGCRSITKTCNGSVSIARVSASSITQRAGQAIGRIRSSSDTLQKTTRCADDNENGT